LQGLPARLPQLAGRPISVSFQPDLAACRGQLLSRASGRGTAVYAASFIRQRKIVFETSLLENPAQLRFFAVHEIFHFVWARLGNAKRAEFARLLAAEMAHGARGELGESSAIQKARTGPKERGKFPQRWRDYVCESFCDTAAWLYAGVHVRNAGLLARRWHKRRKAWFEAVFALPHSC
jgi:hypothetical protein